MSRDVYIRAAPGARHTVLHTSDPTTPWVLRATFDPDEAVLRVGDDGVAWFALVALLPVALWACSCSIRGCGSGVKVER